MSAQPKRTVYLYSHHLSPNRYDILHQALEDVCEPTARVKRITTAALPEDFDGAQAIVMPDGVSSHFQEALGVAGNQRIQRFVEDGGRYFGLCAGAYHASRIIDWHFNKQRMFFDHSKDKLGPNLFNGVARGALRDFITDQTPPETVPGYFIGAPKLILARAFKQHHSPYVVYNGGPEFIPDGHIDDYEVWAQYQKANGQQTPAIVHFSYGLGSVTLMSPHLELSAKDFKATYTTQDPNQRHQIDTMAEKLVETETSRKQLWHDVISKALLPA